MRHIPITCEQREAMLRAVGVSDIDELFADIPEEARLSGGLGLASGLGEIELAARMRSLAAANRPATALVSFAGAGCYDHHIPSVVDHVVSRPEFFTAYTPYQPEVSQGTLQAIYEYQTVVCELTGMDVANASMYDGATAAVEAALMACRLTKRSRVVVSGLVHPEWLDVMSTYADAGVMSVEALEADDGVTEVEDVRSVLDDTVAAFVVSSPNFVGCLEDLEGLADAVHSVGALLVVATNPMLLGVMAPPAHYGADIVVAEGQPLGSAMSFGGPGLGMFACRQEHVRQMPGRLVGRTVDADGNDAFVLTLSTREQHIRREKATSNICSNHALNALAAGVHAAALGVSGLAGVGEACIAKAHYLRDALIATGKFTAPWEHAFAHEFALLYDGDADVMHAEMLRRGVLAGVILSTADEDDPRDLVLLAVTEKRTRVELDAFVSEVASL
jgi:glycine dehydrogenase subunit 1